jgi:hypothetical protein
MKHFGARSSKSLVLGEGYVAYLRNAGSHLKTAFSKCEVEAEREDCKIQLSWPALWDMIVCVE